MTRIHALGIGLVVALGATGRPTAQSLGLEPPAVVLSITAATIKGVPSQLTWSPDNSTLSLQTLEGNSAPLKERYYVIRLADQELQGADAAPEWAAPYWTYKSARAAPGRPDLVIQVEEQHRAGVIPTQSLRDKASNRGIDNAVAAQNAAGGARVRILTLKGEAIGRYVDEPLVPGTTFSWSPQKLQAVVYVKLDGRLGVMDFEGDKLAVDTTTGVLLPAWSPDGSRIVYLRKKGHRDYELMQVVVLHL